MLPEEGKKVIEVMKDCGLVQGENGLEVYVMCEIPSNVIAADAFADVFDGFSIGSNDLTQLTLGLDRDSDLIAHIFDERNDAVKDMVKMVLDAIDNSDADAEAKAVMQKAISPVNLSIELIKTKIEKLL